MLFITQLIYIKPGMEDIFARFEAGAIPIIAKYNGELLFRIRPDASSIIEKNIEQPYEIHLIRFNSQHDFNAFMADEQRKKFLHLKEQSIRESLLIKGEKI